MRREEPFANSRWTVIIGIALLAVAANRSFSDDAANDWKAPPRAAKKPNPIPADDDSKAAGKQIYAANCLACHGVGGKGDGPAAITCNPRPHDLSDPKIASQSDGELFWKITTGKKPMPAYEKQLRDDDRWKVVIHLRVLTPRPVSPSGEGDKK